MDEQTAGQVSGPTITNKKIGRQSRQDHQEEVEGPGRTGPRIGIVGGGSRRGRERDVSFPGDMIAQSNGALAGTTLGRGVYHGQ